MAEDEIGAVAAATPAVDAPVKSAAVIRVNAADVLSSVGAGKSEESVRLGTFTQRAGLWLAAGVGSLGVVVTLIIVGNTLMALPAAPGINGISDKSQVDAVVSAYKQLSDATLSSGTALFDSVVVKVLLPVFTSILGYIFGARSEAAAQSHS